jgi:hypothetical protein
LPKGFAGSNWDRAFFYDYFSTVNCRSNLTCYSFDEREIGLPGFGLWRTNGDEDGLGSSHGIGDHRRKMQPFPVMALDKFRQEMLMNRNSAALQASDFIGVIVHRNDIMPNFGEARS